MVVTYARVMKEHRDGRIMNVYSTMPGYNRLANIPRLSKKDRKRPNHGSASVLHQAGPFAKPAGKKDKPG